MRIPTSHVLPISELKINRDPIASGGFSDVFRGRFRGREVCVKRLRVSSTGGPEKVKKGHITPLSIVRRFLMIPTDVISRGRDMETVKTRQRRPVYRCNFRPPPDCIGMDVGRGSDCSHKVEPAHEQDLPCKYSPYPPYPKKYGLIPQQLVDIAEGLNYLHECDVVHGDLKGVSSLPYQRWFPSSPDAGIAYQTRVAEHHGRRRQPRANNRFRPRERSGRRRGSRRIGRRNRAMDCPGNLAGARGTEQTRGCFLICNGHGRGGFGVIRPWPTRD